jgi:hypothetical protein
MRHAHLTLPQLLAVFAVVAGPAPASAGTPVTPRIPPWVHAGASAGYVVVSAVVKDGKYVDPVETVAVSHVASVTKTTVSGKTEILSVPHLLPVTSHTWTCTNAGRCDGGDWTATLLICRDVSKGVEIEIAYESSTGLVLYTVVSDATHYSTSEYVACALTRLF